MQKTVAITPEVAVIGGGMVGAAIAYGLARRGVGVLVLDDGDRDYRAANGNFGLVWVQDKGMDMPAYQLLTRASADLWPKFSAELCGETAIDLQYEQNGGLALCLSEAEFEEQRAMLLRLHDQLPGVAIDWEMLDRPRLEKLLPSVRLGREVVGASFGHRDGQTNPLRLLRALHKGILRRGGQMWGGRSVQSVQTDPHGRFNIAFGDACISTTRVVIAAGLGSKSLAAQVGLEIPIRPQRGQILVTERFEPFLPLPMLGLRQTREGSVLIGSTYEEAGFDTLTTVEAAAALSANAIRRVPALKQATLVRQWAALRILTPDNFPIYAQSQSHPGAFVAVCHSAVTLAAVHATLIAEAIAAGRLPSALDVFHHGRFNVPQGA